MLINYRFIKDIYALEEVKEEIKVKRSFKERFLSWPFTFWIKEKTVIQSKMIPAMFMSGNTVIYHPSFEAYVLRLAGGNTDLWNSMH